MKIKIGIMVAVLFLIAGGLSMLMSKAKTTPQANVTSQDYWTMTKGQTASVRDAGKGKMPPALKRHLEELQKANPGYLDREEGPGGPGDEKLLNMAYPASDITLAQITGARSAAATVKKRKLQGGKGQPGAWINVGTSNAVYPFFEFRDATLYVPSEYVASGRITSLALANTCTVSNCRLYVGAAGGGVWRTDKALTAGPSWKYLSAPFEINTIGALALDPNDPSGDTIYAGTGEFNACGDCAHGAGLYKSTNGGSSWTQLGKPQFNGRAIGSIAIKPGDPNTIYVGSGRGVHGYSSVTGGAESILIPGAALWGLYKSTDGGASFTLIHNGAATLTGCTDPATIAGGGTPCSSRGVRQVELDPVDSNTVYASSYARGIWRSNDEGATWTQIHTPLNASATTDRPHFATTVLGNGDTRMYVGHGLTGAPQPTSRLFRSDSVRTGSPVFTNLTSSSVADPGYGSFDYCGGQCWYDNMVYTPPGYPDLVYLGGSYQYNENDPFTSAPPNPPWVSNGRGVVLSQDAGVSWTDQSYDATDLLHPFGLHPDHHAIVTVPGNPFQFFEAGDGGLVRSSGQLTDFSAQCSGFRGLTGTNLARCQQILSAIPTKIYSLNKGLNTLQFQSVLANPHDFEDLQGGTQDNGTWESYGNPTKWVNTMIGDGGQSGFDVSDPNFRFHSFTGTAIDVNFSAGEIADWNWVSDPFNQGASFYAPIIHDPVVSGTLFAGSGHVWRTKTSGMGALSLDAFRARCNEWTGDFSGPCGDWVRLGPNASSAGALNNVGFGSDRLGGTVASVERAVSDTSTIWAATTLGRVFVSKNGDAEPEGSVVFTRIDPLSSVDPGRFVSGIFIDPADANHAWISYGGFSANTLLTPGHIFSVTYDPIGGTATWTSLDGSGGGFIGDMPLTDVVFDQNTGDLYVACDFGVFREPAGGGITWGPSGPGLPNVEITYLHIVPNSRLLYAASHGLGAWRSNLP